MNNFNRQLQQMIDKEARKANTHAVLLGVQSGDGRVDFCGAAGDAAPEQPFFVASITKMFTAAVIMQLVDEGRLDLNAPVPAMLPQLNLARIHVHKGTDYSPQLKVHQLVQQTSGLADYYEDGLVDDLKQNKDFAYTVEDVLTMVRGMAATAVPDSGKAHYSDTNYQLLGAIIEAVTGQPLAQVFQMRIFGPLGLENTAVYDPTAWQNGRQPLPLYHEAQRLDVPLALSSMAPDGGIVSTLADGQRFLRAFFGGELFTAAHLPRMMQWHDLFFPLQYGYGLMRFKLPRWMNLFRETPELIGHSGSSGSFAFYVPQRDLTLVGTFNQIDKPQRPFNFMLKVINTIDKAAR